MSLVQLLSSVGLVMLMFFVGLEFSLDISKELKLEIQLVTTIVNRLMAEGLVERVGWGKYKLKIEQAFDDEYLTKVASDMREMAEKVLGASKLERAGPGDDLKGAFVDLVDLYSRVRSLGGDSLAANLLRLSAKKNLVGKDVESLLSSVEEVVH